VLLVDVRPERRELVRHLVEGTGMVEGDVGEAGSSAEAVDLLDQSDRDVAVVEIQMPVTEGLETIAALRQRSSDLKIVVCSFQCDEATKEMALARGADTYVDKPVNAQSLAAVLRRLFPETGELHQPPGSKTQPPTDQQILEQPQPTRS
jgi:CheY-like chemotaxis protein